MKKIFTLFIAVFAIALAKAGTFGMGDYVWKDDASQSVLKTNGSFVKNDRQPIDLEMSLGMWTFFKTQGNGTIVLQYARGNANGQAFVAGAGGTSQAQSPNYQLAWVTINTDSIGKDWVLARNFSSLTEGDYTPSGLTDYSGLGAYAGPTATTASHTIDFGGKVVTSNATGITLDGTTVPGFVSGDYNYMKGALKFAIMPGSTILPDSVYSFRLLTTTAAWDGQSPGTIAEQTINFNTFEGGQNRIKDHASEGNPDPVAVNGGNHFDHGMPFIATGPDIATASLPVKWSPAGLQVTVNKGTVVLSWATETELNNKEFTIERSVNGGSSYQTLGTVASKANGGYSTTTLNYSFTDVTPATKAVYRVGEVSKEGAVSYSNSVNVTLADAASSLSVYPNPAASRYLTVKGVKAGSAYRIVSLGGTNVAKGVVDSSNKVDVTKLIAGVYILQVITDNGTSQSVTFVKK
ncbi:Por secretion system C-terminal sorting domain-containing protein [Arachidicoccus rhizosphaerae]|uniref:Por secretion system C-terminal sorting domain-containing protein n=1 Tax=Arachidicoccus rhizosphaerae TaxID=551991 RepID=A0A1H3ZTY6_9BACT|nr:T9SS type A sorting domain-containing protein [Arachidicoccus rhizosphaerae]SEA27226.1 Por secretion system C-terminal sorting domain-containing protein [Arachidicoccus rhizosphaerae]